MGENPKSSGNPPSNRETTPAPIPFVQSQESTDRNAGAKSPEGDIRPGSRIAKYQVVRLLGRGGMGQVFEALDVVLHRKVALKILPKEFAEDEASLKRFIREARLAARLNHPNAVCVYDIGKKDSTYYIAMELVPGVSVQHLIESKEELDWQQATRWIADACRALSAAHQAGLVHRDIKPGNMLKSDSGIVKLSDFGLAKPTEGSGAKNITLTQKDAFLGTPLYMSPEQCRNDKTDGRSDLYGLGATYFTLLAGEPPFAQGSAMQILFAHCSAPIPDVCEKNPALPEMCGQIIRRAMAKDPNDRYQNADEMLADLEGLLGGSTSVADPTLNAMQDLVPDESTPMLIETPAEAPMSAREKRILLRTLAIAAVVLAVGGIIAVVAALSDSEEPEVLAQTTEAIAPVQRPTETPPNRAPTAIVPTNPPPATPAPSTPPPAENLAPIASAPSEQPAAPPPDEPVPSNAPVTATPPAPAPAEAEDFPDDPPITGPGAQNDPGIRAYNIARQWAQRAYTSKNKDDMEQAAIAMILWHDFFSQSPMEFHTRMAAQAKIIAEKLSPGISTKYPRAHPKPGGPPVPPDSRPGAGPGSPSQQPPVRNPGAPTAAHPANLQLDWKEFAQRLFAKRDAWI